ncbi:DUF3761 domain-containing protein [Sphingomonas echinoides]|uniref:DUF3761 domain-containing protein n=1 Tax=Sphingomonas TaxID=13687 RepID=UPI001AE50EBA
MGRNESLRAFALLAIVAALSVPASVDARRTHHHHHHSATSVGSGDDYYTARNGHRVHRPMHSRRAPSGASARCRDGSWSFSQSHRGTCSWHGGVSQWL